MLTEYVDLGFLRQRVEHLKQHKLVVCCCSENCLEDRCQESCMEFCACKSHCSSACLVLEVADAVDAQLKGRKSVWSVGVVTGI